MPSSPLNHRSWHEVTRPLRPTMAPDLICTRYTGIDGARTWCGHGIFKHNLIKIAALTETT
jgi:hypothetical protein